MGVIRAILSVLLSAGVLYYLGKSGFQWGKKIDEDEN